MGFFTGLADLLDYMMNGEDSTSAIRDRIQKAEYELKAQEAFEQREAAKAEVKAAKARARAKRRSEPPTRGFVDGDHEVYFKKKPNGETYIADAKHGSAKFNREDKHGNRIPGGGQHDHYGSGKSKNNNGTSRGYYTGPGH